MQPSLRVQLRSETVSDARGHPKLVHRQDLQRRRWWGWQTIDEETIPDDISIVRGCLSESDGWTSRFAVHGTFGRDGYITSARVRGQMGRRIPSSWSEPGSTARRLAISAIIVSIVLMGILVTDRIVRPRPAVEPEMPVVDVPHEPGAGSHTR